MIALLKGRLRVYYPEVEILLQELLRHLYAELVVLLQGLQLAAEARYVPADSVVGGVVLPVLDVIGSVEK